ncbi:hypothetical protein JDV02_000998 [Purpureocillium takamizusanense]|uniref:Mid2 domain-containing protein n=1 Tax=Purpureocillium takamizusanense TaxID=2060973 RepID=A0A9Q8Q649_9HYPO|nr:uncharacterized protein JDV02_000998 [Purpureocillium takamizusanense]UNI14363.1 hypothetical protein JDV02_000998 [Purpureocillium takamizusanense]
MMAVLPPSLLPLSLFFSSLFFFLILNIRPVSSAAFVHATNTAAATTASNWAKNPNDTASPNALSQRQASSSSSSPSSWSSSPASQSSAIACGFRDGNPSEPLIPDPGFDCRIDAIQGIWGVCATSIVDTVRCFLPGSCVDDHGCKDACDAVDRPDLTTTCDGGKHCSTALLILGPDEPTYASIGCGLGLSTDHYLIYPTTTLAPAGSRSTTAQAAGGSSTTGEGTKTTASAIATTTTTTTAGKSPNTPSPTGARRSSRPASLSSSETASPVTTTTATTTTKTSPPPNHTATTTIPSSGQEGAENQGRSKGGGGAAPNNTAWSGIIVGGAVGGLAVLCASAVTIVYLVRRHRGAASLLHHHHHDHDGDATAATPGDGDLEEGLVEPKNPGAASELPAGPGTPRWHVEMPG